ncbi:hypothetical protein HN992_03180 [Candidatus Woesearchaeota archaeon]|jgi:hypothetical protein|nr:hypothetical protein [Candidatus Woesearchaeota archaeon]MBT3438940.1 hypothetical protein [Candidatus Woesearchaeota archaeon]MBT4057969.1 hypothetical protein [Candidatus Woesearchaeota archaeon]MBT4206861.1 hypothetical protein [Candidatus Woesearchaeota archaeon]MBT4733348.1 hypothetical protein [Candidatus Woesearchaeota archaeon]
MKNKKGFIKTLEAVLAIIVLLSLIFTLTPKTEIDISKPNSLQQAHNIMFSEISQNISFRECILDLTNNKEINSAPGFNDPSTGQCLTSINTFLETYRPHGYIYLAEVCDKSASCLEGDLPIDKQIYSESIMLASDTPKVFRIYFWER